MTDALGEQCPPAFGRGGFLIMASISTTQLATDLDFANLDMAVTLTTVSPAANEGDEFEASQEALREMFEVEVNGREAMVDRRFFINVNGVSTYPTKGWVLTSSGDSVSYKVNDINLDAAKVMLTLTCISQNQSG